MRALGLGVPGSWLGAVAFALGWLALMLAYSPIADRLAARLIAKPPTLGAFRVLQTSRIELVLGIVVAWIFGGFLEELVFRGLILRSIHALLSGRLADPLAVGIATSIAAAAAAVVHLYQGPRAALIIAQLSILFGLLFVLDGYNLWAVILCHGLYDTIAFMRFARSKSRYAKFDDTPQ